MYVTPEVKKRVQDKVEWCVAKANEHFGRTYSVPPVHYDARGTVGGYHQYGELHLNPVLLMQNIEHYISSTVPHETAHHIDTLNGDNQRKAWGAKRSIHGPTWIKIMNIFGIADPSRTHTYDVSDAQVKIKKKFEYQCLGCSKSYIVSSVRHNRIRKGAKYTCPKCGREKGILVYRAGLGQVTTQEARAAVNQKAPIPKVPVEVPKVPEGNNIDRARKLYGMYGMLGRGVFIRKCTEAGIKDTTASTYYQNFRSGK